ncbi:hypothetical protein Aduo_011004 [Ancylostoma duodenale]
MERVSRSLYTSRTCSRRRSPASRAGGRCFATTALAIDAFDYSPLNRQNLLRKFLFVAGFENSLPRVRRWCDVVTNFRAAEEQL